MEMEYYLEWNGKGWKQRMDGCGQSYVYSRVVGSICSKLERLRSLSSRCPSENIFCFVFSTGGPGQRTMFRPSIHPFLRTYVRVPRTYAFGLVFKGRAQASSVSLSFSLRGGVREREMEMKSNSTRAARRGAAQASARGVGNGRALVEVGGAWRPLKSISTRVLTDSPSPPCVSSPLHPSPDLRLLPSPEFPRLRPGPPVESRPAPPLIRSFLPSKGTRTTHDCLHLPCRARCLQ